MCKSRKNLVLALGNPDAQVMFIAEAPGKMEDDTGKLFVGKSGQLLDKIFKAIAISREDVYITNIVKCRPPMNRNPLPEEKSMSSVLEITNKNYQTKSDCAFREYRS